MYSRSAARFRVSTGYDVHRGCLALAERPRAVSIDTDALGRAAVVVLEGVANADNVGGVFRNAAAFGADAVLLEPGLRAIRCTARRSGRRWRRPCSVPFARLDDWRGRVAGSARAASTARLQPRRHDAAEPAQDLDEFAASRGAARLALLLGSEGAGVSRDRRSRRRLSRPDSDPSARGLAESGGRRRHRAASTLAGVRREGGRYIGPAG